MEFIKGKWYEWINPKFKTTSTALWIVKGIELTNDNKLVYKERINRNKSYNLVKETYCEWDDELREADMNEVSKFLPEGHPDKIIIDNKYNLQVGDVIHVISDWTVS